MRVLTLAAEGSLCAAGFDAAVADFERWICFLLLDGLQRAGFFRAPGDSHTLEGIKGSVAADYARFVAEALAILQKQGAQSPLTRGTSLQGPVHFMHSGCVNQMHILDIASFHSQMK